MFKDSAGGGVLRLSQGRSITERLVQLIVIWQKRNITYALRIGIQNLAGYER